MDNFEYSIQLSDRDWAEFYLAAEECSLLPAALAAAEEHGNTLDVTWPEMYDYFFCDSQGEEEGTGNPVEQEEIPLEREISFPELYEHFFNEPEGNRKKVKGKDRKRKKFSSLDQAQLQNEDPGSTPVKESLVISIPEVYEHFFADGAGSRGGWRGVFLTTPASEVKKAVGALKSLLQRPVHLIRGQVPAPHTPVRRGSGEKLPLVPLAPPGGGQARPEALDVALALTGRPEAPLALTHKDMCLVFCAFASWAVKTSDLQAPDAWKTSMYGRPEAPLALTHKDMCLVFCAFASWAVKTSDLQAPDAWKTKLPVLIATH
nr:PREDICTED: PGC-1 and ERR-induced regulator in muscle protein 1 [Apteryx mantelli mantelli]